jgi:phage terminase large subunit-like protein
MNDKAEELAVLLKPVKEKKTVEDYLDEVDYGWKGYVPTIEALRYATFIQEVNGGAEDNKTPIVHLAMMDKVFNKKKRSLVLCHRGLAKTTLFAEYLFLHIAAFGYLPGFGKVNLALYVTDSVENGVKNLRRNIEHRYSESEAMQAMVPNRRIIVGNGKGASLDVTDEDGMKEYERQESEYQDKNYGGRKFTDVRLEFENYKGHKFVVKGYGAASGVRGSKEMGIRPQLVVFDDIISDDDARSPTVINTIEDTVHKAVSKALDPTRQKQIWLGTPFNQNDPIYKAAESGRWEVACYPIAQDFDGTTTREDFKGSWEERFGYDYVKDEYDTAMAMGRPDDFYKELMLRISNSDDRLIPEKSIKRFDRDSFMIKEKGNFYVYITTDAGFSESRTADFSVILVWAIDHKGKIYLIDWWLGKVTSSSFVKELFKMTDLWKENLQGVGIETNGQQAGAMSFMEEKMFVENKFFFLLSNIGSNDKGIRAAPGMKKYDRFKAIEPWFVAGKINLPLGYSDDPFIQELENELKLVAKTNTGKKIGKARHDDVLDAIAMLGAIDIANPPQGLADMNKEPEKKSEPVMKFLGRDINFAGKEARRDSDSAYGSYL